MDSIEPPNSVEAEEAVLGSILIDQDARTKISLQPEDFHSEKRGWIYAAMQAAPQADFITVCDELDKRGQLDEAGGPAYVTKLINAVPTSIHAEYYAGIVAREAVRRKAINVAGAIAQKAYACADLNELSAFCDREVMKIRQRDGKGPIHIGTIASDLYNQVEAWSKAPLELGQVRGLSTGFRPLNELTGGFWPGDLVIVCGRPAMGKCLGFGTRVLKYDGTLVPAEKLQIGDCLMGPDSRPRRIIAKSIGYGPMFKVQQTNGITYRVNEHHVLALVRSKTEKRKHNGDKMEMTVSEYLEKSEHFHNAVKGYKVAVHFPEKMVPIEPYFLGLWLGDGHSSSVSITNLDQEVIDYLRDYASRLGATLHIHEDNFSITFGKHGQVYSLQAKMRRLGLLKNKHIPLSYLANSEQVRLELLAGLIDSDGHYQPKYQSYEIVQKNKRLAHEIKRLADSLGFSTSIVPKLATIKDRGYSCQVYRVRIGGNLEKVPCRIERKKARAYRDKSDPLRSGLTIEPDGQDHYVGFELDGDGLFLLEDMTVTHNSSLLFEVARRVAGAGRNVLCFSLEMTAQAIVKRWVCSMSGVEKQAIESGRVDDYSKVMMKILDIEGMGRLWIDDTPGYSASDIRAISARYALEHGVDLIVVDHCGRMKTEGNHNENTATTEGRKSSRMKDLAKELKLPVILAVQMSRAAEGRGDKRPTLPDLRGTGEHEENADIVLGLYREEYYDKETDKQHLMETLALKQREGASGVSALLYYDASLSRFDDVIITVKRLDDQWL